jgi:hypothetical protein
MQDYHPLLRCFMRVIIFATLICDGSREHDYNHI